jgi:uncharacterized protein YdgA (DUF945 family)
MICSRANALYVFAVYGEQKMQKPQKADEGLEKTTQSLRMLVSSIFQPKKIIITIGMVSAFALAVPVVIGHYVEKHVRAAFDYLSRQSPMFELRIANYDKGLFTSKAIVNIVVKVPDSSQVVKWPQKVEFSVAMLIVHGPVTFRTADGSWGVRPALAVGHLSFSPANYMKQFLGEPKKHQEAIPTNALVRVLGSISPMVEFVAGPLSETIQAQIPEEFRQIGEQMRASGEALLFEAIKDYPPIKVSFTRPFEKRLSIVVHAARFDLEVRKEDIPETKLRRVHWEGLEMSGKLDLENSTSEWHGMIKPFQLDTDEGRLRLDGLHFAQSARQIFQPIGLGNGTFSIGAARFEFPDGQSSLHMKNFEAKLVAEELEGILSYYYELKLEELRHEDPSKGHKDYNGVVGFKLTGLDWQSTTDVMRQYQSILQEPNNDSRLEQYEQSLLAFLTDSAKHRPGFIIDPLHITVGQDSIKGKIEASLDTSQDTISYCLGLEIEALIPSKPFLGYQDYNGLLGLKLTGLDKQAMKDVLGQYRKLIAEPENELLLEKFRQSLLTFLTNSAKHRPSVVIEPIRITFGEDTIESMIKMNLNSFDVDAITEAPSSLLSSLEGEATLTASSLLAIKLAAANTEHELEQMVSAGLIKIDEASIPEVAKNMAFANFRQAQGEGWIKLEGNALVATGLLKEGKLILNGQELPLPLH